MIELTDITTKERFIILLNDNKFLCLGSLDTGVLIWEPLSKISTRFILSKPPLK